MANYLEDVAVSGEYVETLKDKTFEVVKAPHYEMMPNADKPEEKEKRLVMSIKLCETGAILDYYPNKSSQKCMANMRGYDMDLWVGHKFEWSVNKQKAFGQDRKVLFVEFKRIESDAKGTLKAAVKTEKVK